MIAAVVTPYAFRGSVLRMEKLVKRLKDLGFSSAIIADPNFHAHVLFNVCLRKEGMLPIHAIVRGKRMFIAKNKEGFRKLVAFYSRRNGSLENVLTVDFSKFKPIMYLDKSERSAYEIMKRILGQEPIEGDFSLTKKEEDPSVICDFEEYDLSEEQVFPSPPSVFFDFDLNSDEEQERFKRELSLIREKGFEGYFTAVKKIVDVAKSLGIRVGPGRGSAVGSFLAYLLGITQVNPLRYGLLFERFINEGRKELPDIDIDVEDLRRRELIKALEKEFGFVALVSAFATLKEKALRNSLRKLGVKVSKDVYELLKELPVRRSIHAAGVIISAREMNLPYYMDDDLRVCEYDMDSLKLIGIEKMDILGLKTLSFISALSERTQKDTDSIKEEKEVFEDISWGMTSGVFQLESSEAKRICRMVQPSSLNSLSHVLALNRPGPLKSGLHFEYLKRRVSGRWRSPEKLEEVLDETFGLPIYQEQIMLMAVKLSGMSMSDADYLRKAVAKKDPKLMKKGLTLLEEGMRKKGFNERFIRETVELMKEFASYAFNKSHSVAYAHISYWLAYYKHHFFPEFLLTFIDFHPAEVDKIFKLVQEGICRGYRLLPPDVNSPLGGFEDREIVLPLHIIKGIGREYATRVDMMKPFSGVTELSQKVGGGSAVENLIKAGAFDNLYSSRREALLAFKGGDVPRAALKLKTKFGKVHESVKPESVEDRILLERDAIGFPLTTVYYESAGKRLCDIFSLGIKGAVRVLSLGKGIITDGLSTLVLKEELPKGEFWVILNEEMEIEQMASVDEVGSVLYDCGILGKFESEVKIPADCEIELKKVR